MEEITEVEGTGIRIFVDPHLYPLEVIYRVCYQFTDRYYLWLSPAGSGDIQVELISKSGDTLPVHARGEFGNALIDHAVRWSVAKETQKVREVIVSAALTEASRGGRDVA